MSLNNKFCISILLTTIVLLALLFLSACATEAIEPTGAITQIAVGEDCSLFLFSSGKVQAIGRNTSGQLGVGDTADRYALTEVLLPAPATEIGVSDDTAYAMTANKRLYLWGDNRYRQAEDRPAPVIARPTLRDDLPGEIKQFALDWYSAVLLTDDDKIYAWGSKLSLKTLLDYNYDPIFQAEPLLQTMPFTIDTETGETYIPHDIELIATNGSYFGADKDGMFFGRTDHNQAIPLGRGEIVKLAGGRALTVLLTADGNLYLWGANSNGELGAGDRAPESFPQLLRLVEPLQDVAVGPAHVLALTRSGQVWAWGDNASGQLGLPESRDVLAPAQVEFPEEIAYIATGFRHSYFVGRSGQLYACGANDYGQLLTGDQEPRLTPVPASLTAGLTVPQIAQYPEFENEIVAAVNINAFLTESGRVYTIGTGEMGSLGTGKTDEHATPTYVPIPAPIAQLEAGYWAYTVLAASGEVYNWGYGGIGAFNALGRGYDQWLPVPTLLPLAEKIQKIHSDRYNTAALGESGRWYMWGDNTYGVLATGDMEFTPSPVAISPPPVPLIDISPGHSHFLGLTADGELYRWGTLSLTLLEGMYQVNITPADLSYKKVEFPEKAIKIRSVLSADYVLGESGNLYIMGKGALTGGVLSINSDEKELYPRIFMTDIADFQISPQGNDALALTNSGRVYYWGYKNLDNDSQDFAPLEIVYPEKIIAVFPGEGIFYVAGERHMYRVDSTWLDEGMISDEFPQTLDYKYQINYSGHQTIANSRNASRISYQRGAGYAPAA
jgi:alpha-tubulin suppressor-like RCC1 family protein